MTGPIFYFVVVVAMHFFGVLIFVTYVLGVEYMLMAPFIALAGWGYMIIEGIGVSIMTLVYKKRDTRFKWMSIFYGILFCLIGGFVAQKITPFEEGNKNRFMKAGFLSGFGATALSFCCLHMREVCQIRKEKDEGGIMK